MRRGLKFSNQPTGSTGAAARGPIYGAVAAILLIFGMLFARLSHFCDGIGRLWLGDRAIYAWRRALGSWRAPADPAGQTPRWQRRLLESGSPILLSIAGLMIAMGALIVVGGGLAWLVLHGYALPLMLGAVVLGGVLGARRARLGRHMPQQDRWN
ncbi:MAG: hypothetical protein IPO81_21045 [Kouleothrix sp.]|nr:hypothetical protein [Kouleothrix sp.]